MLKSALKFTTIGLVMAMGAAQPIRSEDLNHIQQLLSTKKCPGCDLTGAGLVLAKLPGADLSQANLAGANLSQANLTGANLSGANLVGVSFSGTNLLGANLRNANLVGADLRGAYLAGADLTGARLDNADIRAAIALPNTVGTAEEFYRWGLEAGQQKRFELSLDYFDKAISRKPDYAEAFIGRGMSRTQMSDKPGAIADMEKAIALFKAQGDTANAEATQKVVQAMKEPEKKPGSGSNFGQALVGIAGTLLQLFLGY
jgi:uncharacterized protein YjbI with pentapeptide repeats